MPDAEAILQGLYLLLTWQNLLALMVGFSLGIVVGSIPGLVESTFLAIVLPFTLYLDVWTALFFMTAVYVSAEVAGSVPAILLNMPGTPGASATTFDGYALTRKGRSGQAIGVSLVSSSIGTTAGALMFIGFGPVFAAFALNFGSPEMFMLGVFGMTAVGSLTGADPLRGIMSAVLGLLLATTGLDLFEAVPRAHFGFLELYDSLPILPALLGLFGFSELLALTARARIVTADVAPKARAGAALEGMRLAISHPLVTARSALIGMIIGIVPGAGATTANVVSYGQAKQWSKRPAAFGKGAYEGVIATDTSNSSVVPGALVPTLTLGIPGSGTAVIMLAALMMQGVRPGPAFFADYGVEAAAITWSLLACAGLILIVCLPLARVFANIVFLPLASLIPFICLACIVGVFSARGYLIDIGIMVIFGLLGFVVRRYGYSPVALLLGLILGPLLEQNFHRTLLVGGPALFFTKPIALTLVLLSALSLCLPLLLKGLTARDGRQASGRANAVARANDGEGAA